MGIKKVSIIIVMICVSLCACDKVSHKGKVFLVGVDGATWKVINPMLERGELPNLKHLIDTGAYGKLTTDIAESPVSWTSIITGKGRDKHGVNEALGEGIWADTVDLKTNRLWDIMLHHHKRVGVYRWYFTNPYREINGFWIPKRTDEGDLPKTMYAQLEIAHNAGKHELIHLIEQYDCDFIAAFWHDVDAVQHPYWLYHCIVGNNDDVLFEEPMRHEIIDRAECIYDTYRAFDEKIGELNKHLQKEDTVIIVSDHGFSIELDKRVRIRSTLLQKLGISTEWSNEEATQAQGSMQDIIFYVNIQDDTSYRSPIFSGDILARLKEPVTLPVVTITFDQTIMRSARAYIAAQREIIDIFNGIYLDDTHVFELSEGEAQDTLVFKLSASARSYCEQVRDPMTDNEWLEINVTTGGHWTGDDGIIILNGPRINRHVEIQDAHLYDVTPTILYIMGLPVGSDMDGKPLFAAIKRFVFKKRPQYIDSYDDVIPVAVNNGVTGTLDEERKRELRSLGYMQ